MEVGGARRRQRCSQGCLQFERESRTCNLPGVKCFQAAEDLWKVSFLACRILRPQINHAKHLLGFPCFLPFVLWVCGAESRGALWLAAAAGVGIGIPFNLLLMSPPVAVLSGGLEPPSS